jgi:hypothetical protein
MQYLLTPEPIVKVKTDTGQITETFRDALEVKISRGSVRFARTNRFGDIYEDVACDVACDESSGHKLSHLLGVCDELNLKYGGVGVLRELKNSAIRLIENGNDHEARSLLTEYLREWLSQFE